ncbi:hypothetical protein P835_00235 [Citrobacter portucalensis]|nr:hypothetical protein P835_00235 [Citrobacter portucalensis]
MNIPLDLYSKDFELQAGGKLVNPQEHRKLCDCGE